MKRIFSILLLILTLALSLSCLTSCNKEDADKPVFGVIEYTSAEDYIRGYNNETGFQVEAISYEGTGDTKEKELANAIQNMINALKKGEIEYAALNTDHVSEELLSDDALKIIEHPLTTRLNGKTVTLITTKDNTHFDDCKDSKAVLNQLNALAVTQSSGFAAEWELFYNKFVTNKGYEVALQGLAATMQIAVLGLLIGIVIGTLIAIVKVVPKYRTLPKILSGICDVYVGFFRGTPMVVQLLIAWFILIPAMKVDVDNITVAILVFGMNSGAYVSEIMRSGIQAVDAGQLEAARAVGLSYRVSMMKIVIPQAVKNILPTLGNEFIVLVKDTSIVSFIAVVDVTKAFRQIGDANYSYIIPYLMLALVYLVIVMIITLLIKLMERRLARSERRR